MAVYVEVSLTHYIFYRNFYFNIYGVEFYALITILKLHWGPNDFYSFLRSFFDSVIRDCALNFLRKMAVYVEVSHKRYLTYIA